MCDVGADGLPHLFNSIIRKPEDDDLQPLPILQTWALACEPGLCPAIELARAAPAPGTGEAERLKRRRARGLSD